MKERFERWLGLDMPTLELDGLTLKLGFPDQRAIARQKLIVRVATSPLTVGIVSAVIAGVFLKLIGAV